MIIPVMDLKAAVARYLEVVGEFGRHMPLAEFGLSREQTEAMVSAWEEDYQLHRHLELIPATGGPAGQTPEIAFVVAGLAYRAVVFRASIRAVIG
ncbi:MAG: hypothetical protein ACRD88_01630 [Terriglobia bacterium]